MRSIAFFMLALAGVLGLAADARAQYPTTLPAYPPRPVNPVYPSRGYDRYPNPYYRGGYGAGYGYGNALSGAADLQRANSQTQVNTEQARLLREKLNQDKIDTRKKSFDEMMYEKANTPTYLENLTKEKTELLNRVLSYPAKSEIVSGKTLNVMMPYLQSLSVYGTQGMPIQLSQALLPDLNVAGAGSRGGSVGMLSNGGRIEWPIGLQGPEQEKLDKLLPSAYDATLAGKLTAKLMGQIRFEMKTMRTSLRDRLNREEIETSSYLNAISVFNALDDAVTALERPDARKQLNGTYAARGNNVQDLVDYMTANGLHFAPATPGREDVYQATHDAFVRYARVAQSSASFQSSNMQSGQQTMIRK